MENSTINGSRGGEKAKTTDRASPKHTAKSARRTSKKSAHFSSKALNGVRKREEVEQDASGGTSDGEEDDGEDDSPDEDEGGDEFDASHISSDSHSSSPSADEEMDDEYGQNSSRKRTKANSKKQKQETDRKGKGRPSTSLTQVRSNGGASGPAGTGKDGTDLWRPGVKAGLGPGKAVYIEKPKLREEGSIKYAPGKIHPNTIAFLADLKKNNDREWMKSESKLLFVISLAL